MFLIGSNLNIISYWVIFSVLKVINYDNLKILTFD